MTHSSKWVFFALQASGVSLPAEDAFYSGNRDTWGSQLLDSSPSLLSRILDTCWSKTVEKPQYAAKTRAAVNGSRLALTGRDDVRI
jgi:hypothetical protein